jgi:hypothetical protein
MAKNRTVRKSSVRKATVRRLGTDGAPADLAEQRSFSRDDETTARDKNNRLSRLLSTSWNDLEIVRIDRIEISERGWRATFRE